MKSIKGKGIVRNLYPFLWRAAVVFFVAVISACGGGGGGGSSNPPPQDGLSVDKTTLIFTGEEGQSVASQSITGSITGATGPVILKIAYTNQGIQFVTFTQLTPTRGRVDVTPQPTVALAPGSYSDTITVYACYDAGCTQPVTGSPKRVSVSYMIQPRNPPPTLLLSDHGVAFASVPSGAHLTRTLSARDSTGAASTWSATSNESWLTVTGSGNSSGFLTLSANPVGLPDGSYEARVTVTSSNPAIAKSETVRVGLYVSAAASADRFSQTPSNNWVVDPIRPLAYSTSGSQVAIDHVFTGARTGSINVPGATLARVVVGDDGSRLYAQDNANRAIVVIDLDTRQVVNSLGFPQFVFDGFYTFDKMRMNYARVHGTSVLIFNTAQVPLGMTTRFISPVVNAETGEMAGELFYITSPFTGLFTVSRDGNVLYAGETDLSGILPVARVELRANSVGNVYGIRTAEQGFNESSTLEIATNEDGSRVFVSFFSDLFVRALSFDGTALIESNSLAPYTIPGNVFLIGAAPQNVEVDPYGRIITALSTFDFRLYSSNETLVQESTNLPVASIGSTETGALRISSDGLRAMGNGYLIDLLP